MLLSASNSRADSLGKCTCTLSSSTAPPSALAPLPAGPLMPNRRISTVMVGPPITPPQMMPAIAAVMARVSAPCSPASSNSGAKAMPVAGPPVSVAEPASTPNIGCRSNIQATPMPTRFCSTANRLASTRKIITWRPLTRSRRRLALMPRVVKNATISGTFRLVSSSNRVVSRACAAHTSNATSRPPTTGSGRL